MVAWPSCSLHDRITSPFRFFSFFKVTWLFLCISLVQHDSIGHPAFLAAFVMCHSGISAASMTMKEKVGVVDCIYFVYFSFPSALTR